MYVYMYCSGRYMFFSSALSGLRLCIFTQAALISPFGAETKRFSRISVLFKMQKVDKDVLFSCFQ